jgi:hypothetical protein
MTVWSEEILKHRDDCGGHFQWDEKYRIEADDTTCRLTVIVRFHLDPDGVSTTTIAQLQPRLKTAIEAKWSGHFTLRLIEGACRCANYSIVFEVQWFGSPGPGRHTVKVKPGLERCNLGTLYADKKNIEDIATHEFGHAIGLPDEYAENTCPGRQVTTPVSVMCDPPGNPEPRHFDRFATWLSLQTHCTYSAR